MAKISFRYGAVGSSKTANALMTRYNYFERGKSVILLKPKLENRDGATIIKSRVGLAAECEYVEDYLENIRQCDCIIIDEAQFMTPEQVNKFVEIADNLDITIIMYGLKNDFQGHLFDGSKRIIEVADELIKIPTVCWCGKDADFTTRVLNGKVTKTGPLILLGGNESYTALCRKHYMLGQLKGD